jgi:hypothetical protein
MAEQETKVCSIEDIEKICLLMVKFCSTRVRFGNLEVELSPDAWKSIGVRDETVKVPLRPPELCPCGHHLETEHNESGCLFGCGAELCGLTEKEES